jgi:hypothetical protein
MSLNDIIENEETKLIFLKAIKLGMKYAESDKASFYKEKVDSEISILMNKETSKDVVPVKNNTNTIIERYENNIVQLEKTKNIIVNNIQMLSNNNYGYNHSKINLLKTNLVTVMKEIEKNKLLISESLKSENKSEVKKKNIIEVKRKEVVQEQNLTTELQNTFEKLSNLIIS